MLQFPFVVEGKPHDGRLLKMVLKIQLKLLPFSNPSTQQIPGEANNRLSNIELAQIALLLYPSVQSDISCLEEGLVNEEK